MVMAAVAAGAAVLGAAGTAYAGHQAASATQKGADASIQAQRDALAQQAALSKPYRDLGSQDIGLYQSLLTGQDTPGAQAPLSYDQWIAQQGGGGAGGAAAGGGGGGGGSSLGDLWKKSNAPGVASVLGPVGLGLFGSSHAGQKKLAMLKQTEKDNAARAKGFKDEADMMSSQKSHSSYDDYVKNFKPSAPSGGIQQTLESLPGYKFTRDQGIEGAKRAAAASGMNLSGNQLTAVEGFGANLADQTYGERLQQLLQPIQLGQAAAAGQAANIGQAAGNISNTLNNQGQTLAGIDANTTAGITRAISQGAGQIISQQTLAGLNNPSTLSYGSDVQIPNVPSVPQLPANPTYPG